MRRPLWIISLVTLMLAAACSDSGDDVTSDESESSASEAAASPSSDDPEAGPAVDVQIEAQPDDRGLEIVGRTNVQASGNRYLPGSLDLTQSPDSIDLPFIAAWLLPLADGSIIAVSADGSAVVVALDGTTSELPSIDDASVAPLAIETDGSITLIPGTDGTESDVPDNHEVQATNLRAWFEGATERVPHGALGDTTESTRLVIVRRLISDPMDDTGEPLLSQERVVVDLEADPTQSVFEGLAPLLADVDGDGDIDVLTTISDGETGARLAVFGVDGELLGESEPIGQRNRWRHQIAVAPIGPNGELEVVEVQTPHIGGLLQFQRFEDGALTLQHTIGEFRSHVLSSRNLDGAVVFDADGDGQPEAVVPTQSLGAVAVVDSVPADGGPALIELDGAVVSSNLALGEIEGGLIFAVALDDGQLLTWR